MIYLFFTIYRLQDNERQKKKKIHFFKHVVVYNCNREKRTFGIFHYFFFHMYIYALTYNMRRYRSTC